MLLNSVFVALLLENKWWLKKHAVFKYTIMEMLMFINEGWLISFYRTRLFLTMACES